MRVLSFLNIGTISVFLILSSICIETYGSNLTCYQCTRDTNTECSPDDLQPCPPISDRCVTHISKDANKGFSIKRECGLGPCGFNDMMVNKGLGLDNCDQTRDEYFCIFCCRENGCNKSDASIHPSSYFIVMLLLLFICLINIYKGFKPPYLPDKE